MNFTELLEPYAERDPSTGEAKRTVEGQMKWLLRKGFPKDVVDRALLEMFHTLKGGTTFTDENGNLSGHHLDQYLFKLAKGLMDADLTRQSEQLNQFLVKFKEDAVKEYVKGHKNSVWKRVKAVFKP